MEACFSVGVHIQWLLTFESAFRTAPSSQNMSAAFTNVGNVGAVSTATSELVERQSKSYSVGTATSGLVVRQSRATRKTQNAEAKSYSYTGAQRGIE